MRSWLEMILLYGTEREKEEMFDMPVWDIEAILESAVKNRIGYIANLEIDAGAADWEDYLTETEMEIFRQKGEHDGMIYSIGFQTFESTLYKANMELMYAGESIDDERGTHYFWFDAKGIERHTLALNDGAFIDLPIDDEDI